MDLGQTRQVPFPPRGGPLGLMLRSEMRWWTTTSLLSMILITRFFTGKPWRLNTEEVG